MENEYLNDAAVFLNKTASAIKENMADEILIDCILFFALGMERILKGILYNLNPIYVYKTQDFKNTVFLLYKNSLLENYAQNKEISKTPDADVLSFKLSLLRAKSISETTEKHTSLLFSLSNSRDIIAHSTISYLDLEKAKILLLRDFFPLVSSYSKELGLPVNFFIGKNEFELASISSNYQEFIEDKINIKLEYHKKRWDQLKNVPGFLEKMKNKIDHALQSQSVNRDSYFEVAPCPACDNDSLLTVEIDFDYSEGEVHPIGAFVSKLRCLFCKLKLEDYDEIDYLDLNNVLIPEEDYEI